MLAFALVLGVVPHAAAAQSAPTVATHDTSSLGTILTDGTGATLYTYTPDTAGKSTCYGDCANAWPPVLVLGDVQASADLASKLGLTIRQDGAQQLTYNSMPLYRFVADRLPGDVNGQAIDNVWFVVQPTAQ